MIALKFALFFKLHFKTYLHDKTKTIQIFPTDFFLATKQNRKFQSFFFKKMTIVDREKGDEWRFKAGLHEQLPSKPNTDCAGHVRDLTCHKRRVPWWGFCYQTTNITCQILRFFCPNSNQISPKQCPRSCSVFSNYRPYQRRPVFPKFQNSLP